MHFGKFSATWRLVLQNQRCVHPQRCRDDSSNANKRSDFSKLVWHLCKSLLWPTTPSCWVNLLDAYKAYTTPHHRNVFSLTTSTYKYPISVENATRQNILYYCTRFGKSPIKPQTLTSEIKIVHEHHEKLLNVKHVMISTPAVCNWIKLALLTTTWTRAFFVHVCKLHSSKWKDEHCFAVQLERKVSRCG